MAGSVIRFMQASDLDLHRPLSAIWQSRSDSVQALAEARYVSAERVFNSAISERVDFVLLAGNTCDPRRVGARGLVFLLNQFERLEEEDIPVYWCHGHDDRANRWPSAITWPDNVHRFTNPNPEVRRFEHGDGTVVEIVGNSWTRRTFEPAALLATGGESSVSIAMTGGKIAAAATEGRGPQYWAIGGSANCATDRTESGVVHWSGSPQGGGPGEAGAHGCTIIEMRHDCHFDMQQVPCDVVRWLDDDVAIAGETTNAELAALLIERANEISQLNSDRLVAVTWDLGSIPADVIGHRLRSAAAAWHEGLCSEIQERFCNLLVTGIHWNTPFDDEAFDEDSLRGSFLRSLGTLLDKKQVARILEESIPASTPEELAGKLANNDAATMAMLADQVASLGDSLLDGSNAEVPAKHDSEAA